jgi:lipopolysaccharide transport protein LptA
MKHKYIFLSLFIGFLCFSFIYSPSIFGQELLDIQGQSLHFDGKQKLVVVEGNMLAVYGPWRLKALKGEYYEEKLLFKLFHEIIVERGSQADKVTLKADEALFYIKEDRFKASGNVNLTWGALALKTHKIAFETETMTLEADEGVEIVYQEGEGITATSNKAIFFLAEERIVLKGNALVEMAGNVFTGEEITIYLNDKKIIATGSTRLQIREVGALK